MCIYVSTSSVVTMYLAACLRDLRECKRVYVPPEFVKTGRVLLYATKGAAEQALFQHCETALLEKKEWVVLKLDKEKLGVLYDPSTSMLANTIDSYMLIPPLLHLD